VFARFAKTYQKGDIIFCEYEPGDTFYLIQSGRVEILKIMDDMQKTLDILEPGELFGEMAILEEAPRSATALALDKVVALEFNRENFEVLMQGNPQIALKLLKLFTKRIYDQNRRFMILTLQDPEARVADVFLMLAERQRINLEEAETVEIEASVDDIAHWAGMSPAQCKEVMNHFIAQRRVDLFEEKIVIKNINDFARFVRSRRRAEEME
jgi:CRP-like cAMP-binding protein